MAARSPALGFIFITLFLDILGIGLIVPILPNLVKNLTGNEEQGALMYGVLHGLYALMQFLFAPLLGVLSDRFGRRPVILVSLLGASLDYLLLAWAPTLGWFFLGRIIAGLTGANFTAATAYIADISPPEKRAANFGLVGAAFGFGFIIGPLAGGWLGEFGLRVPFLVAAALNACNWLYGLLVLPESLAPQNRRAIDWSRCHPLGALLALRRHPVIYGLAVMFFLVNVAHTVYPSTWVLYTGHRYGWSMFDAGCSLAAVGVMAAVVQGGLTRVIIPRTGERRALVAGLGIATAAYIAYGVCPSGPLVYIIVFAGSFAGIAQPAAQSIISRSAGADEQGAVQGALNSLVSVAGVIGPPVMAGLFSHFIGPAAPLYLPGAGFFLAAGLALTALGLAVRTFRRTPPEPAPRPEPATSP